MPPALDSFVPAFVELPQRQNAQSRQRQKTSVWPDLQLRRLCGCPRRLQKRNPAWFCADKRGRRCQNSDILYLFCKRTKGACRVHVRTEMLENVRGVPRLCGRCAGAGRGLPRTEMDMPASLRDHPGRGHPLRHHGAQEAEGQRVAGGEAAAAERHGAPGIGRRRPPQFCLQSDLRKSRRKRNAGFDSSIGVETTLFRGGERAASARNRSARAGESFS